MVFCHCSTSSPQLGAPDVVELIFSTDSSNMRPPRTKQDWETIKVMADALKQIPAGLRYYDPITNVWTIEGTACLQMIAMLLLARQQSLIKGSIKPASAFIVPHISLQYWLTAQTIGDSPKDSATWENLKDKVKAEAAEDFFEKPLDIIPTATIEENLRKLLGIGPKDEITRKLYLTGVRKHHPDLGGDPKIMSELNQMWTMYQEIKSK
jgi:hypothetical protein